MNNIKSILDKSKSIVLKYKLLTYFFYSIISLLITIPCFLFIRRLLPNLHWEYSLINSLTFILFFLIGLYLLLRLKIYFYTIISCYLLIFIIATLQGRYSFFKVISAYEAIGNNWNFKEEYSHHSIKLLPFPNETKIITSIDYLNPKIRNFSLYCINTNFKEVVKKQPQNRILIQCFAVFKEINSRWNYVNDPVGNDYYSKASESLNYFSGDCDDHSILMAASIAAIGGKVRLIHTKKHMYPELYIGKYEDLETASLLIRKYLFSYYSKNKQLYYHVDTNKSIWLNLDYTAKYPGGPFLSEEIFSILELQ